MCLQNITVIHIVAGTDAVAGTGTVAGTVAGTGTVTDAEACVAPQKKMSVHVQLLEGKCGTVLHAERMK